MLGGEESMGGLDLEMIKVVTWFPKRLSFLLERILFRYHVEEPIQLR